MKNFIICCFATIISVSTFAATPLTLTPKNIDIAIERMSIALSNGLNMALHKGFDVRDISEYLM